MPIRIQVAVNSRLLKEGDLSAKSWRAVKQAGIEAQGLVKASKLIPVNTGALRSSIIRSENQARLRVLVSSPLRYAIVQEKGRRAGKRWPPDEPIRQWVLQKGLYNSAIDSQVKSLKKQGIRSGLGRFKGRNLGSVLGKALKAKGKARTSASKAAGILDGLVYTIRRKIGIKGIKGKRFLTTVGRQMRGRLAQLLARELGKG
jgi:hypothetical protein